jgi:hypothetical protein
LAEAVIKATGISSNSNNSTDLPTTCYRIKIRENVSQISVPILILLGFWSLFIVLVLGTEHNVSLTGFVSVFR